VRLPYSAVHSQPRDCSNAAAVGAYPLEGGALIQVEGEIAGAVGVSGVLSSYDAQIARAGAEAGAK
jgi:uncharacterized protein GlcG (DUF336 family)